MFNIKKILSASKPVTKDRDAPDLITQTVLDAQRKTADYLNRKTASWSPCRAKMALMFFCLVMSSSSLFIIGRAILSANGPPQKIKMQRLQVPAPLAAPGSKKPQKNDSIFENIPHRSIRETVFPNARPLRAAGQLHPSPSGCCNLGP